VLVGNAMKRHACPIMQQLGSNATPYPFFQVDVETVMRKFAVRRGDIQDLQVRGISSVAVCQLALNPSCAGRCCRSCIRVFQPAHLCRVRSCNALSRTRRLGTPP